MKYLLVLQFATRVVSHMAIDKLESLIATLHVNASLDGHDIGSGEVNFFVATDEPQKVFNEIMTLLDDIYRDNVKAAYRASTGGDYIVIWPKNLRGFDVK